MNSRDEQFLPEMEDEQQDQRFWARQGSSSKRFTYSPEKVDKADIHSLDLVWERLEEHVARNSAAYQASRNVPGLRNADTACSTGKENNVHTFHKRKALQNRLAMAAALCVLTVLVGSLLVVLNAVHQVRTSLGAPNHVQVSPIPSRDVAPGVATITIVLEKKGAAFKPSSLKVPATSVVFWINHTQMSQVIISDTKVPASSGVKPQEQFEQRFNVAGSYSYHLLSNPGAHATIIVYNATMITIDASKTGNTAAFSVHSLKLIVGAPIIWRNVTNLEQVIIGDNQSIKFGPGTSTLMALKQVGTYSFHLASNQNTLITIIVVT
jgi:plastocyanin